MFYLYLAIGLILIAIATVIVMVNLWYCGNAKLKFEADDEINIAYVNFYASRVRLYKPDKANRDAGCFAIPYVQPEISNNG